MALQRDLPGLIIVGSASRRDGAFEITVEPKNILVWSKIKTHKFPDDSLDDYQKVVQNIVAALKESSSE